METEGQSQSPRLAVIEASSDAEARTFEERSNKKRFYPDGDHCWEDSCVLLITISAKGNTQDHNVLLNRHNYINMGTSQNPPASKESTLTTWNNISAELEQRGEGTQTVRTTVPPDTALIDGLIIK